MARVKQGVTERQMAVLAHIEQEIGEGRAPPNTVELSRHTGYSTGEIARILHCLQGLGYITRIPGRRRNIRLCSPLVKMAPDEHLVAELLSRGYFVKPPIRFLERQPGIQVVRGGQGE